MISRAKEACAAIIRCRTSASVRSPRLVDSTTSANITVTSLCRAVSVRWTTAVPHAGQNREFAGKGSPQAWHDISRQHYGHPRQRIVRPPRGLTACDERWLGSIS
jgi:hypothetical protein